VRSALTCGVVEVELRAINSTVTATEELRQPRRTGATVGRSPAAGFVRILPDWEPDPGQADVSFEGCPPVTGEAAQVEAEGFPPKAEGRRPKAVRRLTVKPLVPRPTYPPKPEARRLSAG